MKKAYLIATLDLSVAPSIVRAFGIYSTSAMNLTRRLSDPSTVPAELLCAEGVDYEDAERKLKQLMGSMPEYRTIELTR